MKCFDPDPSGNREIKRTILELLNQLDVFWSSDEIKVIAATNRINALRKSRSLNQVQKQELEFCKTILEL